MLFITIQLVSSQSRTRAQDELDVARSAFSSLLESRETSSIALTTLITELPVFRAHLTDARLAQDRSTVDAMADGYRVQLDAYFVVVTSADGAWLANPGWPDAGTPVPAPFERLLDTARHGTSGAAIVGRGGELFLAVSVPARFADEVLGTLTTGYRLTDALAEELARLAQCEVVLISGADVAATSLTNAAHADVERLVAEVASTTFGMLPQVRRIGDHQYVGGIFPLRQAADNLSRRAPAAAGRLAADAAVRRSAPRAFLRWRARGVWPGTRRRRDVQPACQPAAARHRGGGRRHRRRQPLPAVAGSRKRGRPYRGSRIQRDERQPARRAPAPDPRRDPRSADPVAQSRAVHGTARTGDGAPGSTPGVPLRGALHRPRSLQARQRQPRTHRGRPAALRVLRASGERGAARRHRDAHRRP